MLDHCQHILLLETSLIVTPRILTFTGAQGVGKTTMQCLLSRSLKEQGYHVLNQYVNVNTSISREAKEKGFKINEETDFETQSYIAYKYMLADIETRKFAEVHDIDYIILDRSVLDVIPYIQASPNISIKETAYLTDMLIAHYALHRSELIYVKPLLTIVSDGERSVDPTFQLKIVREFENVLKTLDRLQLPYYNLERASIEQRMLQITMEII